MVGMVGPADLQAGLIGPADDPAFQVPKTLAPQGGVLQKLLANVFPTPGGGLLDPQEAEQLRRQQMLTQAAALLSASRGTQGLAGVGQALLQGSQVNQQRLQQAQAAALGAKRIAAVAGAGNNVARTFEGANGNMWIIRRDGTKEDLGVPYKPGFKVLEVPAPDGSTQQVIMSEATGERYAPTGQQLGGKLGASPPGLRFEGTGIAPDSTIVENSAIPSGRSQTPAQRAASEMEAKANTQAVIDLPTDVKARQAQIRRADSVLEEVDLALKKTGFWTSGYAGSKLRDVPGTPAFQLQKHVDTIKSNLGAQELSAMRALSSTGSSGLGALSQNELDMLQTGLVALDTASNEKELRRALDKVREHYNNWKELQMQEIGELAQGVEGGVRSRAQSIIDSL